MEAVYDSFRNAGSALQRIGWQFRSYLIPSHLRTYWRIIRQRALTPDDTARKFVYFDLTSVEAETMGCRYLFSLVRDFEALGFLPCYRNRFPFLASMGHREFKRLLLQRPFRICASADELPEDSVVAEVTDQPKGRARPNHREVLVRYDAAWPRSAGEIPMTFFVHPLIHDQLLASPPPDLDAPRPWRIFFSGRASKENYNGETLRIKFGKMSRCEILKTLDASLPVRRLHRIETASDLAPGAISEPAFVRADPAHYGIPQADWLNTLERAGFFLACPGMGMPLRHNLVESLSRAAVPILEHPEFLDPPLQHNVNCLAFRGRDELLKTFEYAFQLKPDEIRRLRHGAYEYYKQHLAPGAFAKRLLRSAQPCVDLLLKAYRTPRTPDGGQSSCSTNGRH